LYRSDQGKYFLKINQNYFAHICPEYGFRVKLLNLKGLLQVEHIRGSRDNFMDVVLIHSFNKILYNVIIFYVNIKENITT